MLEAVIAKQILIKHPVCFILSSLRAASIRENPAPASTRSKAKEEVRLLLLDIRIYRTENFNTRGEQGFGDMKRKEIITLIVIC
jgi:hypothetical protein